MKRSHHTDASELDLTRTYAQTWYKKPRGIWYDINGSWVEYTESNDYHRRKNQFLITIDTSKIIIIDSVEKIASIHAEFKFVPDWAKPMDNPCEYINWQKVYEVYSGVEMNPFIDLGLGHRFDWQPSWDVASGCIWDLSVIKSINLILDNKPDRFINEKSSLL